MAAQGSPGQRIFGPFVFNEATGELRKHGVRVRLSGQPQQILSTLIREPGRLVSRDELHQQLWNGSTFVDFDHGLNAAMNRLRQVLGDSADQPRYVETVPGRGYRFVAEVYHPTAKPVLVMERAPDDVSPLVAREQSRWKRWWPLVAAGVIAILTAGYLATKESPATGNASPIRFSISPPDGFALEAGSSRQTFALSPDGARLAFTAMDASGVFQAFVRDLDSLDTQTVPNARGAYHVFWAPDGRSLFLTVRGSLRRYPLAGDAYQTICNIPAIMLTGVLAGPNLLLSARKSNFVVPASGGTPTAVPEFYPWPQPLPDEKHLLYTSFDAESGRHRARVVEMGKPETARDLLETDSRVMYVPSVISPDTGYLLYVRAGNLIAHPIDPRSWRIRGEARPLVSNVYSFFPTGAAEFSVSKNGLLAYLRYQSRSQLAWVDRGGRVVRAIGPANVNVISGRLSPDRNKIAALIFDVHRGTFDIWILDALTGAARQLAPDRGVAVNPVWAPDSYKLAFGSAYEGPPQLFLRGIGENDKPEPLSDGFFQVATDWSLDGRFVAFTNTGFAQIQNELKGDIWLVDMAHGRKVVPLAQTPFHEANPAFSPDGRWLAFTSNESGRTEIYLQAFESGGEVRLAGDRHLVSPRSGVISLRWRRDGRELFYLAQDGQIYAVPIAFSPKLQIGEPSPLFTIPLEARAAVHGGSAGFDVSPDGQQFLVPIVTSPEKSEIVVMQNWETALLQN